MRCANTPIHTKISTNATNSSAARFTTPVTKAAMAAANATAIAIDVRTSTGGT